MSALDKQVSGDHYKDLKIQPIEYIHANGIPFAEGSVIKYVSRWRAKGGIKDLEKAKHFLELLIELETKKAAADNQAVEADDAPARAAKEHAEYLAQRNAKALVGAQ